MADFHCAVAAATSAAAQPVDMEQRTERTTVAIIGGGVGGLAAAVALAQAGTDCLVFERDATLAARRHGYGMTLSSDAKGPLGALGILERCRALDCASAAHWVFDGAGRAVGYYGRGLGEEPDRGLGGKPDGGGRSGSLRVQRQQLREVLLERLEGLAPGRVRWGRKLAGYVDDCDGVTAAFDDGSRVRCDALVGCDGLRSEVRRRVDAAAPRPSPLRPVGVSAVVGLSRHRDPLVEGRGFYVLDGASRLFTMPFSPVLTMWQLSYRDDGPGALARSDGDGPALLAAARSRVAGWRSVGAVAAALVDGTDPGGLWASRLYDRDAMAVESASRSRVTVLGDACHPMTCFKGAGANSALADAPLLARCLGARGRDVAKKLRVFEREMVARAGPRAAASREAAAILHSGAALTHELPSFARVDDGAGAARRLAAAGLTATSHADLEAAARAVLFRN